MLTREENLRMTQVGRGTPMGELLRRYWYPIAAISQMKERDTLPVRLLGEDLVLYRDLKGNFGLITARCPHRGMSLVYGIPTECGLRCPYHGWAFDSTGACTEQPYEDTENPQGHYKDKIKTPAYHVAKLGGMLFGYLGPDPVPVLPPWDVFVMDGMRDVGYAVVPCNWLQIMENSLDPVHVEWLHQHMRNYVFEKLGKPKEQLPRPQSHKKIGFDAFDYGIIKRRVIDDNTEENEDWATGHPVVFPNFLKSGSVSMPAFQIRVPIDDEKTAYWWYRCYTPAMGIPNEVQADDDIPFYVAPVPQLDTSGLPQWNILDNNSGQDIVAWITQGTLTDRSNENLGRSDKGIVLYRRMLKEAMQAVESGRDPMNVFRDPAITRLDLPVEKDKLGASRNVPAGMRGGNTTKYSPILKRLGAR